MDYYHAGDEKGCRDGGVHCPTSRHAHLRPTCMKPLRTGVLRSPCPWKNAVVYGCNSLLALLSSANSLSLALNLEMVYGAFASFTMHSNKASSKARLAILLYIGLLLCFHSSGCGASQDLAGQQPGGNHPGPLNSQGYNDYDCTQPGYNCDYYDYGVNIEGTGSLGILENILLNQVNSLSNLTPRLAARARANSAVTGLQTASRRNTTVVIQNRPSRTAGLYTTGGVGTDPTNSAALSAGTSSAVAKNIVAVGFPVNNYGSSGESFGLVNASSGVPGLSSAARSLSGGLAAAGNRAVITTTGTFAVGPVVGVFLAGNRAGSTSQNGVATQAIGTTTNSYLQVSSLAVISPGSPALLKQQHDKAKDNKTVTHDGVSFMAPSQQGPDGKDNSKLPYQDYYYYEDGAQGSKPDQTNSAGGASKAWLRSQDLLSQPSRRTANTRGQINIFGAANGFGWTRGTTQSELVAAGTLNSGARLRSGAFGTGASSLTASVGAVTDLQVVQCKKPKGVKDAPGSSGGDQLVSSEQDCPPDQQTVKPAAAKPAPAGMTFPSGLNPSGLCKSMLRGASVDCSGPGFRSAAGQTAPSSQDSAEDSQGESDLLTPQLAAILDGGSLQNMFLG